MKSIIRAFSISTLVLLSIFLGEVKTGRASDDPKIKTPLGELQGKYLKSRDGKTFSAFLGIPYAEPPKRFEAPKPVKAWNGIKNANDFGSQCPQGTLGGLQLDLPLGKEDCLFLNVYTPDVKGNFPVMVLIHGGAYMMGASDIYGGEFYMDEPVVLVTINYRVGAFGFLSTGDDVISGNFGLKDQIMALRWVQGNIKSFGGDKDQVTIFGVSAGGGSVSHLILSPLSKGLFHRAISQSGSALNPWCLVMNPKKTASELAKKIACPTDDSQAMAECLKGKTVDEIIKGQTSLKKWYLDPIAPFAPTVEVASSEAFLAECPHKILKEGRFNKVPWLVSVAKDEGQVLQAAVVMNNENMTKEINEEWDRVAPITLAYDDIDGLSAENIKSISSKIRDFYFGDKKIEKSSQQDLSDLYSDRWFVHGVQKAALLHAKHSPVHAAIFGYHGSPSALIFFGVPPNEDIVTHGDDIKFHHDWSALLGADTRAKDKRDIQERASRMLVKLWVQFASRSDTEADLKVNGVTWPKVSTDEIESGSLKWLLLDDKPEILSGKYDTRMKFWDEILNTIESKKSSKKIEL